MEPSHEVTLTHSTIQYGLTALELASFNGHHKVVELLLGAGANPDLQDKVRIGQESCVHVDLSNGRWYILHPGAFLLRFILIHHLAVPNEHWYH